MPNDLYESWICSAANAGDYKETRHMSLARSRRASVALATYSHPSKIRAKKKLKTAVLYNYGSSDPIMRALRSPALATKHFRT